MHSAQINALPLLSFPEQQITLCLWKKGNKRYEETKSADKRERERESLNEKRDDARGETGARKDSL